jgi:hypothetical protein
VATQAGFRFRQDNGARGKRRFLETTGSGACWLDYDGDGKLDVYLVQNGPLPGAAGFGSGGNRLYRNLGGGKFQDVTTGAGVSGRGYGQGCSVGDLDNDGDPDLFVTAYGRNLLYRNNGAGTFTDVATASGLGAPPGWSTSASFADYDGDGRLDLYVGHYCAYRVGEDPRCPLAPHVDSYCRPDQFRGESGRLYHNEGAGKFRDVTQAAGVLRADGKNLGVIWGDYDEDGRPDLFVANDNRPNLLFHNLGNSRFEEVAMTLGVALAEDGRAMAGMGVEFGDYDNDRHLDLMVTNYAGESNALWRNPGQGMFLDVSATSGVGPPSVPLLGFGVTFLDADRDGDRDLAVANGHVQDNVAEAFPDQSFAQPVQLLRNRGDGTFVDASTAAGPDLQRPRVGRGLCAADYDDDGDPDLLLTAMRGPIALFRNDSAASGHWIGIRCRGTRGNRDALGAQVTVTAGGRTQVAEVRSASSYLSQGDPRLLFGLGSATQVDRVSIRWPGGGETELPQPAVDRYHSLTE